MGATEIDEGKKTKNERGVLPQVTPERVKERGLYVVNPNMGLDKE